MEIVFYVESWLGYDNKGNEINNMLGLLLYGSMQFLHFIKYIKLNIPNIVNLENGISI